MKFRYLIAPILLLLSTHIYAIDFSNKSIIMSFEGINYNIILENKGTISGDSDILCNAMGYIVSKNKCTYNKWEQISPNKILITNVKGTRPLYISFFKDCMLLLIFKPTSLSLISAQKTMLHYDSDFKNNLDTIQLNEYYQEDQIAFLKAKSFIRYIVPEVGLELRKEPTINSEVIDNMNKGDKFFIIEKNSKIETINGKKGQWNLGYWRSIKGWAFDAFMQNDFLEMRTKYTHPSYKNFKFGYIFYPKTSIYEFPDKSARIIFNGTLMSSVRILKTSNTPTGWVYIETGNRIKKVNEYEPFAGCVEEKNICFETEFKKLSEFQEITVPGLFYDISVRYNFKKNGTCIIDSIEVPQVKPVIHGSYDVYKYEDLYLLKDGDGTFCTFRFKNNTICGLNNESSCD